MGPAPICTDELVDRFFSRPVAKCLVKLLAPTPITPNQVTVIAALFGIAIGVALYLELGIVAAVCVAAYLALDCADGQLARLRGGGGYLGRAVDGVGDYVTAISVHVGLALWIGAYDSYPMGILLAAAAGGAMAWASFMLDRYKRRYRGDTDDIQAIEREIANTPGYRGKLISVFLLPYAKRLEDGVVIPDQAAYRQRVAWPLRLWLLNGPTGHLAVLIVCCVFAKPALYTFIAVGPMVLLTLLAIWWQHVAESLEPAVVAPPPRDRQREPKPTSQQ